MPYQSSSLGSAFASFQISQVTSVYTSRRRGEFNGIAENVRFSSEFIGINNLPDIAISPCVDVVAIPKLRPGDLIVGKQCQSIKPQRKFFFLWFYPASRQFRHLFSLAISHDFDPHKDRNARLRKMKMEEGSSHEFYYVALALAFLYQDFDSLSILHGENPRCCIDHQLYELGKKRGQFHGVWQDFVEACSRNRIPLSERVREKVGVLTNVVQSFALDRQLVTFGRD